MNADPSTTDDLIQTLPLDPFPWVHRYNAADVYSENALGDELLLFEPSAGYEQDPMRYDLGQHS